LIEKRGKRPLNSATTTVTYSVKVCITIVGLSGAGSEIDH